MPPLNQHHENLASNQSRNGILFAYFKPCHHPHWALNSLLIGFQFEIIIVASTKYLNSDLLMFIDRLTMIEMGLYCITGMERCVSGLIPGHGCPHYETF